MKKFDWMKILFIAVLAVTSLAGVSAAWVVSIPDGTINDVGQTTTVQIYLDEAPQGLAGANISYSLTNSGIAEIMSITPPPWASPTANSALPADSVWIVTGDLSKLIQPGATNILLGTLTIRGDAPGTTDVTASFNRIQNESGFSVPQGYATNPTVVPGTITVLSATGSIAVTSTPSGAKIFLDGVDTTKVTPFTLLNIPVGNHAVYVTLSGYDTPHR